MICNTIATINVPAGMAEWNVHSPEASKPQYRKKVSEKPSRTVIAVMMPCR